MRRLKFLAPPPFATPLKFFASSLTKKSKVPKIPSKREKLCFLNIEKKIVQL